jgi:hypothetical protein
LTALGSFFAAEPAKASPDDALKRLIQGNAPRSLHDVAKDFPEEATAENEFCGEFGIKSALAFPFIQVGAPTRAILYASANQVEKWSDELISNLQSIGQILASALTQKYAEESLRENEATINLAARSADFAFDGERAGKIIRGIREMVRKVDTACEVVDMNQVVKDMVRLTISDGLGIGLAIARSIVDSFGGSLDAANAPDGGAVFYFNLPAYIDRSK